MNVHTYSCPLSVSRSPVQCPTVAPSVSTESFAWSVTVELKPEAGQNLTQQQRFHVISSPKLHMNKRINGAADSSLYGDGSNVTKVTEFGLLRSKDRQPAS